MEKNLRAELEQTKYDLNTTNDHLKDSTKITCNMAMYAFKEKAVKKQLGKYYYEILNTPVTQPGSPT